MGRYSYGGYGGYGSSYRRPGGGSWSNYQPATPGYQRWWNGRPPQNAPAQPTGSYGIVAPAMPAMPTTAYQPARQGYGYRSTYQAINPFSAYDPNANETRTDYYRNNPQAVTAEWLTANPVGEMPAAMRRALEQWLGDRQAAYAGQVGMRPDLNLWDWLGEGDFLNDYEASNPNAGALRANYRTRYLRR